MAGRRAAHPPISKAQTLNPKPCCGAACRRHWLCVSTEAAPFDAGEVSQAGLRPISWSGSAGGRLWLQSSTGAAPFDGREVGQAGLNPEP